MASRLVHVLRAATETPWAILPEKLAAISALLEAKANGERFSDEEILARIGGEAGPPAKAAIGRGVAVLPLYGVISPRMGSLNETSGGTSAERFAAWFDAALADESVGAIVLDIDSPGGSVAGIEELSARIFAARGTKPIIASVGYMAASAAYWIAASADEIVVTESSQVGSIGIIALHADTSEADAKEGVKVTVLSYGEHKAEESYGPLTKEAAAAMQERINAFGSLFVRAVARGRGTTEAQVRAEYGKGRIVSAQDALMRGMADRSASLAEVIAEYAQPSRGKARAIGSRAAAIPDRILAALDGVTDPRATVTVHLDTSKLAAQLESLTTGLTAGTTNTPVLVTARQPEDTAPTVVPVLAPAPTAKEHKMAEDTAANAAATAEAVAAARREITERDNGFAVLAEQYPNDANVADWLKRGLTVQAAKDEILTKMQARLNGQPTISGPGIPTGRVDVRVHDGGDQGSKHGPYFVGKEKPEMLAGFGNFLSDVAAVGQNRGISPRLKKLVEMQASISGAGAQLGSDGAFLIQKEFRVDLLESSFKGGDILSKVDTTEVGANADGLEVAYLDETSRATGSRWGGIQIYRGAEADSATAKKPKVGKWESRLEDLIGAAYMTERLLQDAPAMADVFSKGFSEEFTFVSENEVVRGSGVGQMLGILTALYSTTASQSLGPTVSVAKETGQLADTILAENIEKMWTRVHPQSRSRGQWFINVECEPELGKLMVGTGTSGQLVYMPPGGLSGLPYGTLKGRPVTPIEYASGLGDVGDIFFADFSRFKVITKGGLQADDSIHVRFLNNERTFRWITRINGAPKDKAPITPFKATDSTLRLSPFVVLAAR